MGGSSSISNVTQDIETHIVNQSDINIMNKISNKTTINEILKVVQTCSASIFQGQTIKIINIKSAGNINITIDQLAKSGLTFSCLQKSTVRNTAISSVSSQIYAQMQSKIAAQIMAKLEAYAKAQAKSGWAGIGNSSSASNVNVTVKNYVDNKVEINLKNVMTFFTDVNINSQTLQNCASSVTQTQSVTVQNTDSGANTVFAISQSEGISVFTNCMQQQLFINKIYTEAANGIGIKVINNTAAEVTTESTASSIAEAIEEGIGSVFKAIGDLLKNLFEGIWSGPIIIAGIIGVACLCVVCLIVLGVIGFKFL